MRSKRRVGSSLTILTVGAATINWMDVLYSAPLGGFVLSGENSDRHAKSADGYTWTVTSNTGYGSWVQRSYHNDSVIVDQGGAGSLQTSPDGVSFTTRTSNTSNQLFDGIWDGSQFIGVGDSGRLVKSSNGTTWTVSTIGVTSVDLRDIIKIGSTYYVCGRTNTLSPNNRPRIYSSTNTTSWTQVTNPASSDQFILWKMASSGSVHVVVARQINSTQVIWSSTDGSTWTQRSAPVACQLEGVCWDGARFIAAGFSGVLLQSSNGEIWTQIATGITTNLKQCVSDGNGKTIVAGEANTVVVLRR